MGDLVTVAELREHVKTGLPDTALDRMIDANEQAILARVGPLGNVTDVRFLRGEMVVLLGRKPSAIISVTELYDDDVTSVTLSPNDYVIDGSTFRRLDTGTHPPDWWRRRATFIYTPADDEARRVMAVIKLCALDVTEIDSSAVVSRTVGQHAVTFGKPEDRANARRAIWDELETAQIPLMA